MSRNHYPGDPYWLTLRWRGECKGCKAEIPKGAEAFRYKDGSMYGGPCGCGAAAEVDFQQCAALEDPGGNWCGADEYYGETY